MRLPLVFALWLQASTAAAAVVLKEVNQLPSQIRTEPPPDETSTSTMATVPDRPVNIDDYEVTEQHESARTYAVGRPPGSADAETAGAETVNEGVTAGVKLPLPSFDEEVYWEAGKAGDTDPDFRRKTGIYRWEIDIGGFFFKYRLWIWTAYDHHYRFYDLEPDVYDLNVYAMENWHYIDYNSANPTIVRVQSADWQSERA